MPTMFTVKSNPEYPGTVIPVILLDGKNVPEDLMAVDTIGEAKVVVWACYGVESVFVPKRIFQEEIEARSFHTSEMIRLLDNSGLTSHIVYGASMRPMRVSWARIDNAVFIDADKATSGFHSYVVVPVDLSKEVIEKYELAFVSRPSK